MRSLLDERYATQTKALDAAFAAADKAVQTALLSAEKAVSKAEVAAEKRFEAVNEFRGQLSDQAQLFLPRTEYAVGHENLEQRVSDVSDRVGKIENLKLGGTEARGAIYAAAGFVLALLLIGGVLLAALPR